MTICQTAALSLCQRRDIWDDKEIAQIALDFVVIVL
jgi:hypothetical protein